MTRGESAVKAYVSRQAFETPTDLAQGIADRATPKLDAILYREAEARYGGPNSFWATNVKRAIADDAHPLKTEWRTEMRAMAHERREQLQAASERYARRISQPGMTAAERTRIERSHRREVQLLVEKATPQSFVSWAADQRRAQRIERQSAQLARTDAIRDERQHERELGRATSREQQLQRDLSRALERQQILNDERSGPTHSR
jgi:hypothetical protein